MQAFLHFRDAADLMRVVAAGKDLAGAGEADGQLERARIEVNGVKVKLLEVGGGRARDVFAAVGKSFIAAIETLSKVWDSATEVPEDPFYVGKTLSYATEDEAGGGERGVHEGSRRAA